MTEALRFGSQRATGSAIWVAMGLGLKTASLSQARCVTVVSRPADRKRPIWRSLDLDLIAEFDDWVLAENPATTPSPAARRCSAPALAPWWCGRT